MSRLPATAVAFLMLALPCAAQSVPRRPGDPSELYTASKKIQATLGWRPEHGDLPTILRTTWRVYQHHFS